MSPAASACLFPNTLQPLPPLILFLFSFFTSPIFPPPPLFFYRREKTPPLSLVSELILTPGYQPADERWATVLLLYMHPTTPCCLLQSGKQHPQKKGKEPNLERIHSDRYSSIGSYYGLSVFHSIRMDLNHLESNLLVVHPTPPSAGRITEWFYDAAVSWNN